ncbi:unnamed protein product [Sphenostylis stenocarpa]|uniref:BACK domain-containing protein n=1 Tax=Sphenostylis stenocarpa TaxID=92480 RepID=A0AA86S680_9FABA|nr:unnamed protein product [Sphenostylis stenocarpa]
MTVADTDDVSTECNFAFAFNNVNFSDRILNIEVIPDHPHFSRIRSHSPSTVTPSRKRSRHGVMKANDVLLQPEEKVNCHLPDAEETVAITEASSPSAEEAAVMDLLNFMYSNTLSRTAAAAVLDVLMAADKFDVVSCIKYCSKMLRFIPMTCKSALLYLDLPSSILTSDAIQPLIETAKLFLASHYRDITKFADEALNLPLAGIEAVLSSDDLQLPSEDAVYEFVLKWARIHYPKIEDRRDVLGARLGRLIRFPHMSCRKLEMVLKCSHFHPDFASKVVLEALFFKAETPRRQRSLAAQDAGATYSRFVERAYMHRRVKVVEFALPQPQCVIYLDLKKEECAQLFPNGRIHSQAFPLGEQLFFLSACCNVDQQNGSLSFGLFLAMKFKESVHVEYEFAARSKFTEEYISRRKANYTFTRGKAVGHRNLFGVPWTAFIADDSHYFIKGYMRNKNQLIKRPLFHEFLSILLDNNKIKNKGILLNCGQFNIESGV